MPKTAYDFTSNLYSHLFSKRWYDCTITSTTMMTNFRFYADTMTKRDVSFFCCCGRDYHIEPVWFDEWNGKSNVNVQEYSIPAFVICLLELEKQKIHASSKKKTNLCTSLFPSRQKMSQRKLTNRTQIEITKQCFIFKTNSVTLFEPYQLIFKHESVYLRFPKFFFLICDLPT